MVDKSMPAGGIPPELMAALAAQPDMAGLDFASAPAAPDDETQITTDEAGNVELTFGKPAKPTPQEAPFDANLAEYLPDDVLNLICSDLTQQFDDDKLSREDWERTYKKGTELLGMKIEERTFPFKGACGIQDPMIAEAVVRFQSNAIMEIFPEGGPARSKILGNITPQKEEKAERIEDYYNYLLTEKLPDYRPETERLLFSLALCGAAFRKIYPDPVKKRPAARFVPADQFIIPFGCSTLEDAPRYTEVLRLTKNDIYRLQASGFYRNIQIASDPVPDRSSLDEAKAKVGSQTIPIREDFYTNLEMHVDYDLPGLEDPDGIALPYIITIQKDTQQILSIYRNWDEKDVNREKLIWYSDYSYIPGIGFYGLGLVHLAGGLAKGGTSILRQLIDAGTLANLRGGFKTRGLRIRGDDTPIAPGEWRDVDVPTGKIEDNIFPLPYGEPSGTLLQLLGIISDNGRRLCSIADVEIGDVGAQAPVGTTLSIMERAMKVMSAVQARLHESMHKEFKILARVIKMVTPAQYDYDVEGGSRSIKHEDFDGTVDVVPVSNPNAATMSQRVTQYQAGVQLASQFPNVVNIPELVRRMFGVLGIPNLRAVVPDNTDIPYLDPVTENGNLVNGRPVKAFDTQDHEAHIQAHQAFMQDPKTAQMIGQNPQAQAIFGAIQSHLLDHYQYKYRRDLERQLGMPLPPVGQSLPPEIETKLSQMVAQAAWQLMGKDKQEAAMQQAQQQQQDPVFQLQQREMLLKEQESQRAAQQAQAKQQFDAWKAQMQNQIEQLRIAQQAQTEEKRIASQEYQTEQKVSAQILKQLQDHSRELQNIKTEQSKAIMEIHQMMHNLIQPGTAAPTPELNGTSPSPMGA